MHTFNKNCKTPTTPFKLKWNTSISWLTYMQLCSRLATVRTDINYHQSFTILPLIMVSSPEIPITIVNHHQSTITCPIIYSSKHFSCRWWVTLWVIEHLLINSLLIMIKYERQSVVTQIKWQRPKRSAEALIISRSPLLPPLGNDLHNKLEVRRHYKLIQLI